MVGVLTLFGAHMTFGFELYEHFGRFYVTKLHLRHGAAVVKGYGLIWRLCIFNMLTCTEILTKGVFVFASIRRAASAAGIEPAS